MQLAIEIAADVFGDDEQGFSHEHVIITGSSDPRGAAGALARAGNRFYVVGEDGPEPSEQAFVRYVSAVRLASRGPWFYVDCQGSIPSAMGERMVAVLVEEMERGGVSGRIEVPSEDELDYDAPPIRMRKRLRQ
jgi:NAD(P)-dependent dehydrogenase (short-subunit alcohol dehydrogenase family)